MDPNEKQTISTDQSNGYFLQLEDFHRTKKIPASLLNLLNSLYCNNIRGSAELLIAIVYYLILETGYVPVDLPFDQCSDVRTHWGFSFIAQIPHKCWNILANQITQQYIQLSDSKNDATDKIYTFKLKLLKHSDDEAQLVIRKIFNESTLCVTFFLEQHEQSTSIILPVNEYINRIENIDFDYIRQHPQQFFQKTQNLSTQIKQNLVAPLRNRTMYESAYPNAALNGLPKDILWFLFRYFRFDLCTLQKISQTCVYLRNMSITFLDESNIRLKHRQPTPITYNASEFQPRSRFRIYNVYPWIFRPFDY